MSKFKPTESQQLFIDSYNKNTLVSASAGSGKTSTMINKLTDMVKRGVELKRTLVVTYTNSAGSEIKQKLFNSLVELMREETNESRIDFISQQLDDMANCDIGTLHSVCKKIITTYFYVVEQDPTFNLLSEQESSYLFDSAMMKVFNDLIVDNNEEFYSIYKLFNKKRNLSQIMYIVKTLYNYLLSKVDSDEWKNYVIEQCCCENNLAEKYLLNYFKSEIVEFVSNFNKLKLLCLNQFEYYSDYISDRLNFVLAVEKIDDYKNLVKLVNDYEFIKKPKIFTNKISVDDMEVVSKVDESIVELNEIIKTFKTNCFIMDEKDYANYKALMMKLFNLVDRVKVEYFNIKKLQNSLDFSDLEHITLEILENEKVVSALKEKYEYIFVDEYQDINQVQETIINKLKRENNLFMIGDVKQSIYAFRLSSPEIFIDKFNRYLVETENNLLINLNENFRSEENILQFANLVFNTLITNKTIGIDYAKNSQLVAGVKKEVTPCVSMDIIDKESGVNEGQVIAEKVGQLVKEGFNFGDIAILLRSKGELVNEIYSGLKKYNIPCEATYKTDLFQNNEVLVLYYLMKLVNNMNNDIALATILKSVFVGLSDNELAEIRMIDKDSSFYECVKNYQVNGVNEHIRQKINALYNLIFDIRDRIENGTIIESINYILNKYQILNYYLSFVDGLEKLSNIKEFLRLISNNEFKYDLQKCLDYLDSLKKDGNVTLTVSGEGDCVKIMTIHSSKGLEYPAVILGGMGKKFVLNKHTEDIIINDKLGVGVKLFDAKSHTNKDSLIKNACKISNKKSEIDEEIRLLYVALTRAKKRLCIVGEYETKNIRNVFNKNIYSSANYFDLIMKAIPSDYIQFFENKVEHFVVNSGKTSEFCVNFVKDNTECNQQQREVILNLNDEYVLSGMSKYFDYHYPYNINNNVALKNSVSQVLKEEQDYEKQIDSIVSGKPLDDYSLKLGTAYHSIMQTLNYCENEADICEIISNIKTPDLPYHDIDVNKILNAVIKVKELIMPNARIIKECQFVMKSNYEKIVRGGEDIDVLIQGVIDLVILNGNEAIIIDFKTNKTKSEKFLKDHYAMQLKMYADAFEKAYDVNVVKKLLYSFDMGKFISID